MKTFKKLIVLLTAAVAVSVASCVNEPAVSEEGYGAGEVAALRDQIESLNVSAGHMDALVAGFKECVGKIDEAYQDDLKARMEVLASVSETIAAHASYLGTGVSHLEGTLATLSLQKELANAVGALEGSMAAFDGKEFQEAYDSHMKNHMQVLCEGAQNWIGKPFAAYFTTVRAEARMTCLSESLNRAIDDQKNSIEGLISDVEAGIRAEDEAEELYSISEDINDNSRDSDELVSMVAEIAAELEQECESAIRSVLTTGGYDSSALNTLTKSASAVVKAATVTLNDLIERVAACEEAIEDILQRLTALEASLDIIQSLTFVPEYATESAVALYTLETGSYVSDPASPYVGYCQRTPAEKIELNYLVRPAAAAAALKDAYVSGSATVSVIGYYAQGIQLASVSSANAIAFEISDITVTNNAQGLIKVSLKNNLKSDFYFKGVGAKCALSVKSGKTDMTSKFVDIVPKDKSGNVYVESVRISDQNVTFDDGDTYQLNAIVDPSNATDKAVTWSSSNSKVVTIDGNGKMTAQAAGTAVITATTRGTDEWGLPLKATCSVTVQEAIKLAGPAYVEMGKTAEIQLDYPAGLIVNQKTWWIEQKTLGPSATVNNGIVTPTSYYYSADANSYETLFVKCQVNETVVSHELMVVAAQPTAVKIPAIADNVNNATVKLGNTLDLSASIYPASVASGGLFRIQYISDSQNLDVAEINFSTGVVTAKSPGSAYMNIDIYSKDGFYYFAPGKDVVRRTVRVDVEPYWVNTISFAQASYEVAPGGTLSVSPSFTSDVQGKQPSYTAVTWKSSNTSVATVDQNTGLITAKGNGTCTITATTTSKWAVSGGGSKSASFSLTVKEASIYSEPGWYVYKNGTVSEKYTYSSTNPVVGIVVASLNMAAGDNVLANDFPECSNGFAVGLSEYTGAFGEITVYDSGHGDNVLYHYLENKNIDPTSTNVPYGYALTSACMTYCSEKSASSDLFGTSGSVVLTARTTATPSGMSNWYIPSYYEMTLIYNNLEDINAALTAVNADTISKGYYWSSQCRSAASGNYHDMVANPFNMSTGTWYTSKSDRTEKLPVRVVFAF